MSTASPEEETIVAESEFGLYLEEAACALCTVVLIYVAYDMIRHFRDAKTQRKMKPLSPIIRNPAIGGVLAAFTFSALAAADFIMVWYPISYEDWYCVTLFSISVICYAFTKICTWWFFLGEGTSFIPRSLIYTTSFGAHKRAITCEFWGERLCI